MRRDVYSWLGVPSSSDKYQDSLDERVEDTCGWIFDRDEYKNWVSRDDSSSPNLLWINGPAGFGKTILCAHIAQHLSKVLTTPVAYFFFTSNQDTPYLALRSWIHQLADAREDAFECVRQAREVYPTETASRRNVLDMFSAVVEAVPGCTLIADGLDECSRLGTSDSPVARFLSDVIGAVSKHRVRLLFVSRDEPEIRDALDDSAAGFAEYKIAPDDVRSDTAAFSQFIVDKKLSNKSEDIRTTISGAMSDRCEGQFLWVRMQEQSLRKGMSKKRLHEAVQNTPPGLDRLYDHNWSRIMDMPQFEKDRVFALLRWAAFATRRLTVYEITEAALMTQFEELDPDEYPDEMNDDYIRTEIVGLCSPLLEVKDMIVHVPHFSVQQYLGQHLPIPSWLIQNRQLQSSYEMLHHTVIAKACLLYLRLPQTWKDKSDYRARYMTLRFYAASKWGYHSKNSDRGSSVWALATDLLREDSKLWAPLSEYVADALGHERAEDLDKHQPFHPLEYALEFGWKDMTISLINEKNVNRVGSLGRTPLLQAQEEGMFEVVEKLLDAGADVGAVNKYMHTPLHRAAWNGLEENVRILIEHGADLSAQDNELWTPLHAAVVNGTSKTCEYLIKGGSDLTIKDKNGMSPLHMACRDAGRSDLARMMLEHGADSMVLDNSISGPPLIFTCVHGDVEMARLLLEHGAAPSLAFRFEDGATMLMMAKYRDIVKLFLEHGAETTLSYTTEERKFTFFHYICFEEETAEWLEEVLRPGVEEAILMGDVEGRTPLHVACQFGNTKAVELMLGYKSGSLKAMIEARTTQLWTPLWLAARNGHLEIIKILLEHGAAETIAAVNDQGKTALWVASKYGHTDIVRELLHRGAEETIAITCMDGDTALWMASHHGHTDVVKLLLDHGAASIIEVADANKETPLHTASRKGYLEIVDLLLDYGAEETVGILTKGGRSLLYAAAEGGCWELYQKLLTYPGAESATVSLDINDNSLLTAALAGGCVKIVKDLLNRDASRHAALPNKAGETPLLLAANNDVVDIVRMLIATPEYPINHPNNYGVTPLFVASRFGHLETIKLLLSRDDIDLDLENWKGLTPLYAAVANGHLEVAELLMTRGATLDAWPTIGQSLLWWAQRSGKPGMVEVLHKYGMRTDTIGPCRYHRRKDPEEDAAPVVFEVSLGYCDVYTLTIADGRAWGCNVCWHELEDSLWVCEECFGREYDVCRNGHGLVPKKDLHY